jgi:glycosyltransferase involved in cell wall biosynthesis
VPSALTGEELAEMGQERTQLVVDSLLFSWQAHGGLSRLFSETLPRMCDLAASLSVELLVSGPPLQPLPAHSRIAARRVRRLTRPAPAKGLWGAGSELVQRLLRDLSFGRGFGKIWHSTYYTLPGHWRGAEVVTVADTIYELFPTLFSRPEDDAFRAQRRRCLERADAVICISHATRADVGRLFPDVTPRTHVVHLAGQETFRPLAPEAATLPPSLDRPFLLFVGRRRRHKNFDLLLRAFACWPRKRDFDLVAVGPEWSAGEKGTLLGLGLTDSVRSLQGVGDEALCVLYNRAAAFVYPSLCEGFGVPILEAMACGCPVVASRIPSSTEVAGECPVYFTPDCLEELGAALDVVVDEGRPSTRTAAGLDRARRFSWDRAARETLDVYRSLAPEAGF